MAVHTCTGYNNHYMYLNHGQQTIPNGLVRTGEGRGRPTWVSIPVESVLITWELCAFTHTACPVPLILPGARPR